MADKKNPDVSDPDVEYLGRIKSRYDTLSRSHKKIARYILDHQDQVAQYSITTMAEKMNTTPSTITRFCQALSYKGFAEFKVYLNKKIANPLVEETPIYGGDSIEIILQKLIRTEQTVLEDTLRTLDGDTVVRVVDAMLKARSIVFLGQSGGYISARFAQQQLRRMNMISQAVTGNAEMELTAAALGKNDVAVGIAYSGEVSAVVNAFRAARANRATVVAITAAPSSSMARMADFKLYYSHNIPDDLQYLHVASMCEIAVIGAVVTELFHRPQQKRKIEYSKKVILMNREK